MSIILIVSQITATDTIIDIRDYNANLQQQTLSTNPIPEELNLHHPTQGNVCTRTAIKLFLVRGAG